MSFYSSLALAANEGVRGLTSDRASALFGELDLFEPAGRELQFSNLTSDITALFADPAAHAQNDRFFTPDSIAFANSIDVVGPECEYAGPGWSVEIHGNGYLFPWEITDVRILVQTNPKLVRLRAAL